METIIDDINSKEKTMGTRKTGAAGAIKNSQAAASKRAKADRLLKETRNKPANRGKRAAR